MPDIGRVMEKKSKHIPFSVTSLIGMFDEAEIKDPRSQMQEQTVEVVNRIPRDQVEVSVPKITEEIVEVIQLVPQEQIQ